jgi:hypothetical protein
VAGGRAVRKRERVNKLQIRKRAAQKAPNPNSDTHLGDALADARVARERADLRAVLVRQARLGVGLAAPRDVVGRHDRGIHGEARARVFARLKRVLVHARDDDRLARAHRIDEVVEQHHVLGAGHAAGRDGAGRLLEGHALLGVCVCVWGGGEDFIGA